MDLAKFCPRCGERTQELMGEKKKVCGSCYTDERTIAEIPGAVEITVCSVCGRMKQNGNWEEIFEKRDRIAEKLSEYNKPDITMNVQYWEEDGETYAKVQCQKETASETHECKIEVDKTQCKNCSKFRSGYYKAKIQVRGQNINEAVESAAAEAAKATNENREDFLSNIERTDHGTDLFVSTDSLARRLVDKIESNHETEKERSYELVGEEDGQKIYKNVISVRLKQK